ncbi:MAG: phosphoglycerate dehydrogenase [Nanoarchaeales archaeon]|nr:phosphoglycerate dehydrogenase [Nanoarchaeales archaeon]
MTQTTDKIETIDKRDFKILLLEEINQKAVDDLKVQGYTNIEYHNSQLPENELIEKIKDVHFIGIRSNTNLTKEILTHAKNLKVIGAFCVGTNQIDLEYCKSNNIEVINSRFENSRSVAELIIGEIIMLLRNIPLKNAQMHKGIWTKNASNSHEIRHKKLGIIGYGFIGSQIGILAEALGMEVNYFDMMKKETFGNAKSLKSMEEVLKISDVVTMIIPANTRNYIISDKELNMMKSGSIFINAGRGQTLDTKALITALKSGKLAGAGLDVFEDEPSSNEEEFISELREFDNVILTPHVGGSTTEAQIGIATDVIEELIKLIQ